MTSFHVYEDLDSPKMGFLNQMHSSLLFISNQLLDLLCLNTYYNPGYSFRIFVCPKETNPEVLLCTRCALLLAECNYLQDILFFSRNSTHCIIASGHSSMLTTSKGLHIAVVISFSRRKIKGECS